MIMEIHPTREICCDRARTREEVRAGEQCETRAFYYQTIN